MTRRSLTLILVCVCLFLVSRPARAQVDLKAVVLKHLTTSRDFTLKVADQMPEADYAFKLTPPQMSFGEQMVHLASDQAELLAPFSSEKPNPGKPASMSKKDVIAFVRQSFERSISLVSKLTPAHREELSGLRFPDDRSRAADVRARPHHASPRVGGDVSASQRHHSRRVPVLIRERTGARGAPSRSAGSRCGTGGK